MNAASIQSAAVLGAGTMGHGIAQVLAQIGVETRLFDIDAGQVEKGLGAIRSNLDKGVAKGKVDAQDRDAALSRLSGSTEMVAATKDVHLVVEAVPEKLELKRTIF